MMSANRHGARSRGVALTALLLAITAPAAAAQRLSDLPAGTQLRLRVEGTPTIHHGTFAGVRADSLAFQEATQLLVVPRGQIWSLEWRDRDASLWPHALVGGLIGGTILAATVAILAKQEENSCQKQAGWGYCGSGVIVAVPAAGLGMLVGAAIGGQLSVERWRSVDPPLP